MLSSVRTSFFWLVSTLCIISPVLAERVFVSTSLNSCLQDAPFTASLFNVVFSPDNLTALFRLEATSSISGKVMFDLALSAYGYPIFNKRLDPCKLDLRGLCPMTSGKLPNSFVVPVSANDLKDVPGIAYSIPDLDATVKVFVNSTEGPNAGKPVACIEANISNSKTVDLAGVKWATAIIAGLAFLSSAIVNGLGHYNTAAHIAANSLSLFSYFQSQAIVGLAGVKLPPIAAAWTQNFQWSLGIIHVGFMQDIFTWYQRATGGDPSTIFDSLTTISVQVEKRALQYAPSAVNMFKRSLAMLPKPNLVKRGNLTTGIGSYVVFGIQRVAFRAKIESTNLFLTGLIFFWLTCFFTALVLLAFKGICDLLVKKNIMRADRFTDFRAGWRTILKGTMYRIALIAFPAMTILCLWEFTQRDSPALVVLAVVFFFGLLSVLGWGAFKVIRIARRSVAMHRNPAYTLFADPESLNKWGFLYIQFRASAYYFVVPLLGYTLIKGMLIALAQRSGVAQAIGLLVVEAAALIAASVLRPWMDKPTNSFNIAICVVNFLNAIILLIFSNVFGGPPLMVGVVGIVFFVLNAAFSLILLLMVIISTILNFFRKNPDARYQIMADDRASFVKSQTALNTAPELDALAATARGDSAAGFHKPNYYAPSASPVPSMQSQRRRY